MFSLPKNQSDEPTEERPLALVFCLATLTDFLQTLSSVSFPDEADRRSERLAGQDRWAFSS